MADARSNSALEKANPKIDIELDVNSDEFNSDLNSLSVSPKGKQTNNASPEPPIRVETGLTVATSRPMML